MQAKPGFPANTALAALTPTAVSPVPAADNALSAAVRRALGGVPARPHLAGNAAPTGTKSVAKARTGGPGGFDRLVTVKPIAPRSGHR